MLYTTPMGVDILMRLIPKWLAITIERIFVALKAESGNHEQVRRECSSRRAVG